MKVYKMFMRNLVTYPWIGPDIEVVVCRIGPLRIISPNYEIRPDRLIEYKPEIPRWLGTLPNFMSIPKGMVRNSIKLINGTTIMYHDSGLNYLENLKMNKEFQKEFDNMMFGQPFDNNDFAKFIYGEIKDEPINIDQYPKSVDLSTAWEKVLNIYIRNHIEFRSICHVIHYCKVNKVINETEERELDRDMEYSARKDWKKYEMYNPDIVGYRWREGDKEIRIKFIKTRISELNTLISMINVYRKIEH